MATRAAQAAGTRISSGAQSLGALKSVKRVTERAKSVSSVVRANVPRPAMSAAAKGGAFVNQATQGGVRAVLRVSSSTLSPDRVLRRYGRAGHELSGIRAIRQLDLEHVDQVLPRRLDLVYSAAGAASGAGAGATISALALTGPGAAGIAGVMLADASVVLGLASAVVAHTALYYGYDVNRPEEKAFVLSVVDFGVALTATGKTAAFQDVSKLSHALRVQKSWATLNESAVARVVTRFTAKLGPAMTKKQLAKAIPYVSAGVGFFTNWLTLEMIADAADLAYRRRWLLDKYPQLAVDFPEALRTDSALEDGAPDNIGVVSMLEDEGVALLSEDKTV